MTVINEKFRRPDVPEGTYIFNIVARNYLFDQVGTVPLEASHD